jgi:methylated-DNA-[protein]-cysteine S-methyltransferase
MRMAESETSGGIDFTAGNFRCTLLWSPTGVREFHFRRKGRHKRAPEIKSSSTVRRLPSFVVEAVGLLELYFSGRRADMSAVPLDLGGIGSFSRRVYREVRKIPYGETASYEEIARRAGSAGAPRAVGMCMKKNPLPIFIPCHRVIRKNREPGGFSSSGGARMKVRLLRAEGAMLILLVACLFCGACCGARGGTCAAAAAADRPWRAELIFSNLCDEKIVAERIEIAVGDLRAFYPPAGEGAAQGIPFGQDALLVETYLLSGRYVLVYAITLAGEGAAAAPLEGSQEFTIGAEPSTVDITLRKLEGGCGVRVGATGAGSGEGKCYEPSPGTKTAEPPCEE